MSKSTSAHPTGGALIYICWYLDLGPSHRQYKCTLSHVDMSALLLKLKTERQKREALEHELDIIKRRLEERSVVQSAADYKQTLFSALLHVQLYLRTGTEATHRQYSEGCLLPHVPSFPCNCHRHPSCVIAELLRCRSREQVTRSGNSLRPPRALPCFSRPLNVKRCLPEAPASNDVYLTRHQAWITCQNLPGSPFSAGSKVIRGIIARRRESLGTRLRKPIIRSIFKFRLPGICRNEGSLESRRCMESRSGGLV